MQVWDGGGVLGWEGRMHELMPEVAQVQCSHTTAPMLSESLLLLNDPHSV